MQRDGGPGGAGGGGNPTGGSYTGPAEAAEYISDRVYAYSGTVPATNSITPIRMLNYSSGSRTQVIAFQFFDKDVSTNTRIMRITLNGGTIIEEQYDGNPGKAFDYYSVIIPPYTQVEFLGNINGATSDMFCTMTGTVLPK